MTSPPILELQDAISLLQNSFGANLDPATELNLVTFKLLKEAEPYGSLERVTFTIVTDSNGQGTLQLPTRYQAIRGVVENNDSTQLCGFPLEVRNGYYEYTKGHLGMVKWTMEQAGVIPLPKTQPSDPIKYKVPVCPTVGASNYFTCICKLAFQMLENDTDILLVQNIDALELGLLARAKRRAGDYARENQLWTQAKVVCAYEKDDADGPGAYGKIQIEDDFNLGCLGSYGSYDGGNWGWGGIW